MKGNRTGRFRFAGSQLQLERIRLRCNEDQTGHTTEIYWCEAGEDDVQLFKDLTHLGADPFAA